VDLVLLERKNFYRDQGDIQDKNKKFDNLISLFIPKIPVKIF